MEACPPGAERQGLPECTSGVAEKTAGSHPVAASPCPISATTGLVSSSTQPCSAQEQVLLIWASQQSHEHEDGRTIQLPTAQELPQQELPQQEPQGSCRLPFPVQLLSPPGTRVSLGTHTDTNGRGVQQATSLTPGKCRAVAALAAVCIAKRQS